MWRARLAGMAAIDPTTTVGVVGAGTMGGGIAEVAAAGQRLARSAAKGRLTDAAARAAASRMTAAGSVADLRPCALVVEAVVEDLAVKRALFAELEARCDGNTILATNTSSLDVTAIANGLARPERVAGMHFFNPAPALPLVEIVAAAQTRPEVLEKLSDT